MKNYEVILFDLDGTLTDSKPGITKSVQYALNKFGIIENDLEKLEHFVGPPLKDSFMHSYGFSEEKALTAVRYYREYFAEKGMFDNSVYPGIENLLKVLKEKGKRIAVATSKPTVYSISILEHFGLYGYFDMVVGSNLDGTRTAKSEVIDCALLEYRAYNKSQVVMVGDRMHDILGAKENGIDSVAVFYGYGTEKEISNCCPTYTVGSVQELFNLLLG
ncbi:MAG: HAD family hydrolase [Clostridia bacterium]|nr:HAD family hydrolase [Clostridia bacterium]